MDVYCCPVSLYLSHVYCTPRGALPVGVRVEEALGQLALGGGRGHGRSRGWDLESNTVKKVA